MTTPTQRVVLAARRRGAPVLTHRQWGSKEQALYAKRRKLTRDGYYGNFKYKVDTVWIHITVTFDSGTLTGDFKKDMQTVERIGKERFGSGFSYNWGVDMKTGMAGVGQPLDSKGTHTINDKATKGYSKDQNLAGRSIACIGMPGDKLSDEAIETIVDILVAMWEEGQITDDPDIQPHSLVAYKDCPTQAVRDALPLIRKRFAKRVNRAKLTRACKY